MVGLPRWYETVITALELTSALVAVHRRDVDEEYLRVELVGPDRSRVHVDVRIDAALMERSDDLPDGTELIRCRTPQGEEVAFLSPPPHVRVDGVVCAVAIVTVDPADAG